MRYTRAMITAALEGDLDQVAYSQHPVFGLHMPNTCPNVPAEILNPRQTWADQAAYDHTAMDLAKRFHKNFKQFADGCSNEILSGAPLVGSED